MGAAVGVCAGAVGARWGRQFGFVVESIGWTLPWACASVRCGHNAVDRVYLRRYYAAGSCFWERSEQCMRMQRLGALVGSGF